MPVYNERATFATAMSRVMAKDIPEVGIEVIVVESNSTDGTRDDVMAWAEHPRVTVILEDRPGGKGRAVRRGLKAATGDVVLIQDADLEYDAADYDRLIEPILAGRADFVLGRRVNSGSGVSGGRTVGGGRDVSAGGSWRLRRAGPGFRLGHLFNVGHVAFRLLFNAVYGTRLRDPFTMYKVFRRSDLDGLSLECDRFDFDWELTAKLIRTGHPPVEVPVSYTSRSRAEGKKVELIRDPLTWIRACFKYRFVPLNRSGG